MIVPTKESVVNNFKVRYAFKSGYGWVVTREIAISLGISFSTLMQHTLPLTSHQITVGEHRAKAIRSDILIDTINKLLTADWWERKFKANSQFRSNVIRVLAFLEDLGNKAKTESDDLSQAWANGTSTATKASLKPASWKKNDAVTPLNWCFDGHMIRFVGTVDILRWVVYDIIAILYPNAKREDYNKYLDSVDVRCLSSQKINIVEDGIASIEEVTTTDEAGIYRLTARCDSPVASHLQHYISRSISTFIDASKKAANGKSNGEVVKLVDDTDEDVVTPTDFNFMGHIIRFVGTPEKPEWVASDAIAILYPTAVRSSYNKYLDKIPPKWFHKKKILTKVGDKLVVRKVTTLYEPGLYQLTARSSSDIAFPFQKWIFEDVLPSIRKTGSYTASATTSTTSQLPPITSDTFTEVTKYAQYTQELVNATSAPLPIKRLHFVRAMRNQFPEQKSFHNWYDAIATSQDLIQYEELTHSTYHAISALAACYASKHKLDNIIKPLIIQKALVEKGLMYKDDCGNYTPTELGKNYSVIGWDKEADGTLKPSIRWRQEVLLLLGILY